MPASLYKHRSAEAVAALKRGLNRQEAAAAIGVHPTTLFRWLKKPDFQAALAGEEPPTARIRNRAEAGPRTVRAWNALSKRVRVLHPAWPADWLREDPRRLLMVNVEVDADAQLGRRWRLWQQASLEDMAPLDRARSGA